MYKVFFEDRVFFLAQTNEKEAKLGLTDWHNLSGISDLRLFIEKFEKDTSQESTGVFAPSLAGLWDTFKACFKYIDAAGGVVRNKKGKLLFIIRHGLYDFPKGKVKEGENFGEGAIREVEEECGITDVKLVKPLPATLHTYRQKSNLVLKKTHWFEMSYTKKEKPTPQTEEDITDVKWLPVSFSIPPQKTYASILWLRENLKFDDNKKAE